MNVLTNTLRELMERHDLTGVQLAEDIGLSATSVSQILTGKTKPRQVTLSRLMKRLCDSSDDEQQLLTAYESLTSEDMPMAGVLPTKENAAAEKERGRRFMEIKAQSIGFKRKVAENLNESGLPYTQDYIEDGFVTDFLVELKGTRNALECKWNVQRDWERAIASVSLLRKGLRCDEVCFVIPTEHELPLKAYTQMESAGGRILDLQSLSQHFKEKKKGSQ